METGHKRKRTDESPRITFQVPSTGRVFERLLQEHSLSELHENVRKKLKLSENSALHLVQIREGEEIDLEDDDDFNAFSNVAQSSQTLRVRVSYEIPSTPVLQQRINSPAPSTSAPPQESPGIPEEAPNLQRDNIQSPTAQVGPDDTRPPAKKRKTKAAGNEEDSNSTAPQRKKKKKIVVETPPAELGSDAEADPSANTLAAAIPGRKTKKTMVVAKSTESTSADAPATAPLKKKKKIIVPTLPEPVEPELAVPTSAPPEENTLSVPPKSRRKSTAALSPTSESTAPPAEAPEESVTVKAKPKQKRATTPGRLSAKRKIKSSLVVGSDAEMERHEDTEAVPSGSSTKPKVKMTRKTKAPVDGVADVSRRTPSEPADVAGKPDDEQVDSGPKDPKPGTSTRQNKQSTKAQTRKSLPGAKLLEPTLSLESFEDNAAMSVAAAYNSVAEIGAKKLARGRPPRVSEKAQEGTSSDSDGKEQVTPAPPPKPAAPLPPAVDQFTDPEMNLLVRGPSQPRHSVADMVRSSSVDHVDEEQEDAILEEDTTPRRPPTRLSSKVSWSKNYQESSDSDAIESERDSPRPGNIRLRAPPVVLSTRVMRPVAPQAEPIKKASQEKPDSPASSNKSLLSGSAEVLVPDSEDDNAPSKATAGATESKSKSPTRRGPPLTPRGIVSRMRGKLSVTPQPQQPDPASQVTVASSVKPESTLSTDGPRRPRLVPEVVVPLRIGRHLPPEPPSSATASTSEKPRSNSIFSTPGWVALAQSSPKSDTMVDELQSFSAEDLSLSKLAADDLTAEETEPPLFLPSVTQPSFPYTQPGENNEDHDQDSDDANEVEAEVMTSGSKQTTRGAYKTLTQITSSQRRFSTPMLTTSTPALRKPNNVGDLYGNWGESDSESENSDESTAADKKAVPSHIPKSRRAGLFY